MLKKVLKFKLIFCIVLAVSVVTILNLCITYLLIPGPSAVTQTIIIEPKLSTEMIADRLKQYNVIKYEKFFGLLAKIYTSKHPLKSGEYVFTASISPWQVLKILSTGKSIVHKMIIPEGATVNDIINKINSEPRLFGVIKGEIPEGYLMPSTYFFSYGDLREQIVDQMRKKMTLALDEVMIKLTLNSPLRTRLEVLVLASIIEKEAMLDIERPMIAAVFLNRLKKGMKLQADPTTIYAITEGKYKLNRFLNRIDLKHVSPYNTYYTLGLPPGAICCPGIKSLQAVVEPASSTSLYFVVNGTGGHNFATTLEQHNNNVKLYRQSKAE